MAGWTHEQYEAHREHVRNVLASPSDSTLRNMVLGDCAKAWKAELHRQERNGRRERQGVLFGERGERA